MSEDRRRKKSWREIDRQKDKSVHRTLEKPGTHPDARRQNQSYKAELDRFFESGVASSRIKGLMKKSASASQEAQESPERIRLIRKIRTAETFDAFVAAVDELRKGDGLPNDADVLTRTLEHPENAAVHEALERLAKMANRLSIADMKSISARLDSLEMISEEPRTRELIEALRAKL